MSIRRGHEESFDDYAVRLYTKKDDYGIDCYQIANILNEESGLKKDESAWRKHYHSFMEGMRYALSNDEKGVKTKILAISDLHYPFSLPCETFADYAGRVDTIVLNGDLIDHQSISKFPKRYRINPIEELIGLRSYFIELFNMIKPKSVYFTYGNHELRMGDYLAKNLDSEMQELLPETVIDYLVNDGFIHYDRKNHTKVRYVPLASVFEDIDFKWENKWWCQIGDVIFCHPKAFASSPMKTTERAVQWFRNNGILFTTLVMAHTHRIGSYKIGNTMTYEQGACCKTNMMDYADGALINSQKEGFLYLCLDRDGKNMEDKSRLVYLN